MKTLRKFCLMTYTRTMIPPICVYVCKQVCHIKKWSPITKTILSAEPNKLVGRFWVVFFLPPTILALHFLNYYYSKAKKNREWFLRLCFSRSLSSCFHALHKVFSPFHFLLSAAISDNTCIIITFIIINNITNIIRHQFLFLFNFAFVILWLLSLCSFSAFFESKNWPQIIHLEIVYVIWQNWLKICAYNQA